MSFLRYLRRVLSQVRFSSASQKQVEWRSFPCLSEEELNEIKYFFPRKKFFVFGHARSGTTLLARLIRVHPKIHCNWQAHFFTRPPFLQSLVSNDQVREWLSRRSNRWNRGKDLSPVVLRVVADFILEREANLLNKTIVGDKSPNNLTNGEAVQRLHCVYPDASLIYIVRDGRDAVLSHRIQSFIDLEDRLTPEESRIRERFIRSPLAFVEGKESLFSSSSIKAMAKAWSENVIQTNDYGKALFADRYYALRFEDLLDRPWETMRSLWEFLGAEVSDEELQATLLKELSENPDAEWQASKSREIVQWLPKGQRGTWRKVFTLQDRRIFWEEAGKTLQAWGYPQE
ncbi:MAG: sulfotransferase family protein [Anaerolineales bacterium]